ncbi:MAG: LptA/OstA family protein, partial [Terriglobia bacterium]
VNKNNGRAHYQGAVRAWRGADVIHAPSLDVDRKTEQVIARGGATTSLIQAASHSGEANGGKIAQAAQPVTIRADRLVYSQLRHTAVYEGHVVMDAGSASVQCDRLEGYFSTATGEAELERAIARGDVRLAQPPGRRGHGERAEYFAKTGEIVLTGGPPVIYDEQQGFLTGRELTFFVRDASLFANGANTSQTLSKRRVQRQ